MGAIRCWSVRCRFRASAWKEGSRMKRAMMRTKPRGQEIVALVFSAGCAFGCSANKGTTPAPACDQVCKDNIAMRASRETMRWVYNQQLPGSPVGTQDASAHCLMHGTTGIYGAAGSNPVQ